MMRLGVGVFGMVVVVVVVVGGVVVVGIFDIWVLWFWCGGVVVVVCGHGHGRRLAQSKRELGL